MEFDSTAWVETGPRTRGTAPMPAETRRPKLSGFPRRELFRHSESRVVNRHHPQDVGRVKERSRHGGRLPDRRRPRAGDRHGAEFCTNAQRRSHLVVRQRRAEEAKFGARNGIPAVAGAVMGFFYPYLSCFDVCRLRLGPHANRLCHLISQECDFSPLKPAPTDPLTRLPFPGTVIAVTARIQQISE